MKNNTLVNETNQINETNNIINNNNINNYYNNNNSVYIMIEDNTNTYKTVVVAKDYHQIALNNYIDMNYNTPVEYGTDTEVCFKIGIFDYLKKGLSSEYDDVYEYIKDNNTIFLISKNHYKLSGLCGFLNRVIG
jgi:hypothetical protein